MKKEWKSLVEYLLIIALTISCTLLAINIVKQLSSINKQDSLLKESKQINRHYIEDINPTDTKKQQEQQISTGGTMGGAIIATIIFIMIAIFILKILPWWLILLGIISFIILSTRS